MEDELKEFVLERHAFLIMAHSDFESLKYLLFALDDERNDIYIHVDKRTRYVDFDEISSWVKKAGLFFTPRIKVYWGHHSLMDSEMILFKTAAANGHYHYYHLLSGVDFPIKSQDYIHEFFHNKDQEFLSYHFEGDYGDEFLYKIKYYHPLMKWVGRGKFDGPGIRQKFLARLSHFSWQLIEKQKQFGIDRTKKYPDYTFVKGDNWCSVTDDFVRYVISKERLINKIAKWTNCQDEFFLQTIAYNSSKFKDRLTGKSLRKIDWNRGTPYEYCHKDIEELKNGHSEELFARKISYVNEPELVNDLMEFIGSGGRNQEPDSNPLVSIVVPIYNVQDYLKECLESLASQTYNNIEVLLINDGSKDDSGTIAEEYAKLDQRFKYIVQENKGLSGARNTGLDKAQGEYIAVVDSDDWVEPDYIEKMLKQALDTNADVVACGLIKENENPQEIFISGENCYSKTAAMKILEDIYTDEYLIMIVAWNKLYKRRVFENVRYVQGKIHEDEYAIHRVIDTSDMIATIDKPLYHYRIRENSITSSGQDEDLRHFHVFEAHQDRVQCCKKQEYGAFYKWIVYSMIEELLLLTTRYGKEAYGKYHLNSRFRRMILSEYFKNYKWLEKNQKKECLKAFISPMRYKK